MTTVINTIQSLPKNVQRSVLASIIGGLNMSIIASVKKMVFRSIDKGHIDEMNERIAELAVKRADAKFREDNGLDNSDPLIGVEHTLGLRRAFADAFLSLTSTPAISIGQSIDFLTDMEIKTASDDELAVIAEFVGLDVAMIARMREKVKQDALVDRAKMIQHKEEILEAIAVVDRDVPDSLTLEDAYATINNGQKFKLCSRVCKTLAKQIDFAIMNMLRGSIVEGAATAKLLKAAHASVIQMMWDMPGEHDTALIPQPL